MSIHYRKRCIIVTAIVVVSIGVVLASHFRNRLSGRTIVGGWQGYALQPAGVSGLLPTDRVPLVFTFRADGVVTRGGNNTKANYMVCDSALVFYDIRSPTAPSHTVLWNARIVGDILTLSGSSTVAVLRRVQ